MAWSFTLPGPGAGTINFVQSLADSRGTLTGKPEAGRRMAAAFGVNLTNADPWIEA